MPRHKLTIVCGNAGAGKTTLAESMARETGALLLDIDTVSERLVIAGQLASGRDPSDRDSPQYKATYRDAIHETLFAIAEQNLDAAACIVVAPLTRERRQPEFLSDLRSRFACPVEVVVVFCDEEERRRRIAARENPRDRAKLQRWSSYAAAGRDPDRPPFEHTFVDTTAAAGSRS